MDRGLAWEVAEKAAAMKDQPLWSEDMGEWLSDPWEDLWDLLQDEPFMVGDIAVTTEDEFYALDGVEIARQFRIYLSQPDIPQRFDIYDWLADYCSQADFEYNLPQGFKEAEDAVNKWIDSTPPEQWLCKETNIAWNGA